LQGERKKITGVVSTAKKEFLVEGESWGRKGRAYAKRVGEIVLAQRRKKKGKGPVLRKVPKISERGNFPGGGIKNDGEKATDCKEKMGAEVKRGKAVGQKGQNCSVAKESNSFSQRT